MLGRGKLLGLVSQGDQTRLKCISHVHGRLGGWDPTDKQAIAADMRSLQRQLSSTGRHTLSTQMIRLTKPNLGETSTRPPTYPERTRLVSFENSPTSDAGTRVSLKISMTA